jgi:hypothetical protein
MFWLFLLGALYLLIRAGERQLMLEAFERELKRKTKVLPPTKEEPRHPWYHDQKTLLTEGKRKK